jgi:hypothetical protein
MIEVKYDDEQHRYWLRSDVEGWESWTEVPSVTKILGAMSSKDALPWWGMRVGMAAVVAMMSDVSWAEIANCAEPKHIITPTLLPEGQRHFSKSDYRREKPKSLVEAWAVENKRSTNHILDEASERGEGAHGVLEALALDEMPDPGKFPEDRRGWVQGIMQWWLDQEPRFLMNEVIVASVKHRFAGRFDTIVQYPDGRICLVDLKTSKGVYKTHLRQLATYVVGFDEMNLWPLLHEQLGHKLLADRFDGLEVLHVTQSGEYRLVPSLYRPEHVTPTIDAYHADREGWLLHQGVKGLWEEVR